jgi:hypothetical protein
MPGSIGAGDALVILLDKCRDNADLVCEICKSMGVLMLNDDTNKVLIGRAGGCRLCVRMMRLHCEDPSVLEACCKLIVEFGKSQPLSPLELPPPLPLTHHLSSLSSLSLSA